jgi:hypothetical protein
MSDHTPQRADIPHPHDRHGQAVAAGQIVHFVHGGDHLSGTVHSVETDAHGVHHAVVGVTIRVPARATEVRPTPDKKGLPTTPPEGHEKSPKPAHAATPAAHPTHRSPERKK